MLLQHAAKAGGEAIAERQSAVNATPDDAGLLIDLGVTAGTAGEFELAVDALNRAAEATPRLADAPFWLGMLHYSQGNQEGQENSLPRSFRSPRPGGMERSSR